MRHFSLSVKCTKDTGLSQSSGFSFRLQEGEDVSLSDWTLHVTDDLTVSLSDEVNLHLGTLSLATGSAKNLDNSSKLDSSLIHIEFRLSLVEVNQAILAWEESSLLELSRFLAEPVARDN